MSWSLHELAFALGGKVCGRQVLAPGPGHSRKDRSLAVRLVPRAPDGFLVHSHAGDDWQNCRDYVRARLGMPAWQPGDERDRRIRPSPWDRYRLDCEAEERRPRTEDDLVRIKRATDIWGAAQDPRGTVAEAYLRARRLELTDALAGAVLRFHPRCPWRDENTGRTVCIPALIAAFRSIDDDAVTAVHRIRVDRPERWPKTERRMLGLVHRAAVKLAPMNGELCIGEGIETCMAAQQLGYRPAWSLGGVAAISSFVLLDGVQTLSILAETGDASADAIRQCGTRWYRAGRRVRVVRPDCGSDLNDQIMEAAP